MEFILSATEITKNFPGVRALDKADFSCKKGEVHALVGENGAGKSTLMKILAGVYTPDAGDLIIKGERVTEFTPSHAQNLGVGIIYQELSLLPYMSAAENIYLAREPRGRMGMVDFKKMEKEALEILAQLDGQVDPSQMVHSLSPAQRQLVEIAKALSFHPDVIIMDEPSSSLTEHELQQLFNVIRSLQEQQVTVIYISHRLEEIFEIADRVTVLKDGQTIGTLPVTETNQPDLIRLMVGRELEVGERVRSDCIGEIILKVSNLSREGFFNEISFQLRCGEILGIAGLVGAGRTDLARSIFGADPVDIGKVLLNNKELHLLSPKDAIQEGLALAPEDRKADGLVLTHSLRENIALPSLRSRQRLGFVNSRAERRMTKQSIQDLSIATPGTEQQVAYLSGGNQQKAVLAKWLNVGPDVIILDEPTRGIDVGAKAEVHALLRKLADSGKAIIMICSELPEILQHSDRILVMSGGYLAGELTAEEANEEKILELAYKFVISSEEVISTQTDELRAPSTIFQRVSYSIRKVISSVDWQNSTVFIMLTVLFIIGALGSDIFLSARNLTNLLRQAVIPLLLGIGQTFVILSGGIDLSVSAVVTLTTVFGAGLMLGRNELLLPVSLLCICLGIFIGALNAFSIIKLRVTPIITTLGIMTIGQGVALIYTREPIGVIPKALYFFAHGEIGPLPASTYFTVVILVGAFILLYKTAYGRHLYAVGGDEEIARISGIRIDRVRALTYLLSGFLAAVTGLYLTSRMGSGDPDVGPGLELDSIAAVLLGGTILGGGRGGLYGTTAGVFVLVVLSNVFNQLGIHTWYQQIAKGLIIILAVTIYHQKQASK